MVTPRRVLSSLSFLATLALLVALFIMVNFIASRRYARWDLTKQKATALSEKTLQVLKSLKEPVTVTVFYQPAPGLYGLIKDELAEYERAGPKLKVEYVDPDQDIARAKRLAQQFQIETLNVVIFESGLPAAPGSGAQAGTRHKYLSDTDLADYDYSSLRTGGEPHVKAFKGEDAFTSAIINVTQAQTSTVWVTSGHGEKAVDAAEPAGLADVKTALEQQNMSVEPVTLLERTDIPASVKLIIIPGPTRRFTESEAALLTGYLQRGGRVLLLIDPLVDAGLEPLLQQWGVVLCNDIVVDPARQLPFVSAANLFVTDYTDHPIVKKMKTLMTLYPLARSVRPVQSAPEGVTVAPLARTSATGWGETKTSVEQFQFNEGEDLKGPVPIAVAAERLSAPPDGGPQAGAVSSRARLVVFGDSDFIINAQLANVGNKDMLLGAIYWLTEQEQLIGIGPRPIESIKLTLTGSQLTRVFWFSLFSMPLTCAILGVGMWWLRRQ